MLSTYPFHVKCVPIPPKFQRCHVSRRSAEGEENCSLRFSPTTHEKRWFGDIFKRHEGGPAPRILGQEGTFLKRFRKTCAPPKPPHGGVEAGGSSYDAATPEDGGEAGGDSGGASSRAKRRRGKRLSQNESNNIKAR
eukprot:4251702-Prymnesium_polylepis.1